MQSQAWGDNYPSWKSALKDPSLLAFDQRRSDPSQNLSQIFGMQNIPSDTQMRTILDPVDPQLLRGAFTDVFSLLQRCHVLKDFRFLDNRYIISLDGTG
jgi:hypothetical protein